MPGTLLGASHTLFVINKTVPPGNFCQGHFTDEETETERPKITQLLNGRAGVWPSVHLPVCKNPRSAHRARSKCSMNVHFLPVTVDGRWLHSPFYSIGVSADVRINDSTLDTNLRNFTFVSFNFFSFRSIYSYFVYVAHNGLHNRWIGVNHFKYSSLALSVFVLYNGSPELFLLVKQSTSVEERLFHDMTFARTTG